LAVLRDDQAWKNRDPGEFLKSWSVGLESDAWEMQRILENREFLKGSRDVRKRLRRACYSTRACRQPARLLGCRETALPWRLALTPEA